MNLKFNEKGQAVPEKVVPITGEAFETKSETEIYWLANAGALINSRGTTLMIDPVLSGFDMPLLINAPLAEKQVHMPTPDAILFNFSDSRWHIGLDGAVKLANAYPKTPLILWHWGSVDATEGKEFNGNPEELRGRVVNPERVITLNPGEAYRLTRLEDNRV